MLFKKYVEMNLRRLIFGGGLKKANDQRFLLIYSQEVALKNDFARVRGQDKAILPASGTNHIVEFDKFRPLAH